MGSGIKKCLELGFMKDSIEAILPKELRIEASVSNKRWARKRIYVIIEPDVRLEGEYSEDPMLLLGRLSRKNPNKIDLSFLVPQDDILSAFLFHEKVRGLILVPIGKQSERGSSRIMTKVINIAKRGLGRLGKISTKE